MKSRSCWLIFFLIGLSLTSCGQQKSSQEIAETVKNSIVLISYQNEGGHGTGFIVPGPTGVCTVLTARHVVEGRSLNLQTNDQKLWKTDSIQASPNLDLAVVTFPSVGEKCPYPSLNLGDSDSVKQSDQIYISGFPDRIGSGKLVQQFVRGSVSGLDVLEQGYGISYEASTFGGMSGGPVLDVRGKVVAVHGKTEQAAARVAGGVQINTFKWGIPIKTYLANANPNANQLNSKQKPLPPWKSFFRDYFVIFVLLYGILGLVMVVVVGTVFALVWRWVFGLDYGAASLESVEYWFVVCCVMVYCLGFGLLF